MSLWKRFSAGRGGGGAGGRALFWFAFEFTLDWYLEGWKEDILYSFK